MKIATSKHRQIQRQRGQSTSEFLVMLIALVPLVFFVVYIAKYGDLKQAANQASRYAAFERSWDPDQRIKTDAELQEEMQVRFFTTKRELHFRDRLSQVDADSNIPLWNDVTGNRLLSQFGDARLTIERGSSFGSTVLDVAEGFIGMGHQLPKPGMVKAQVSVSLADVTHFEPLRNIGLVIPAATAVGTNGWNSSGTNAGPASTCASLRPFTIYGKGEAVFRPVGELFGTLANGMDLERRDFQMGIMKPDVVPAGSLYRYGDLQPSQIVPEAEQRGSPAC
jgi:hypothetical protein